MEIARSSAGGGASTTESSAVTVTGRPWRRSARAATDRASSPSSTGSAGASSVAPAGQGDDLLDETDELLGLGVEVVEHLGARRGVEVGMAAQHGEVRAHARQRRAQLVAGVLDEPPLVVA